MAQTKLFNSQSIQTFDFKLTNYGLIVQEEIREYQQDDIL